MPGEGSEGASEALDSGSEAWDSVPAAQDSDSAKGGRFGAGAEEMEVIGHDAEGMETKGVVGSGFDQKLKDGLGYGGVGEMRFAVVAADGYEIDSLAEVVEGGKAGVVAVIRHTIR